MQFKNLFKPGRIGTLELKNRLVLPAMATGSAEEGGKVSDAQIAWYARRAKGGAGLIILETTFAATAVDNRKVFSGVFRADDASCIPGLARLAEGIHKNGAKAAVQLSVGAGAQAIGEPWFPSSQPVPTVSPSGIPALEHNDQPRALSIEEIKKIVEFCGKSAWNVKKAGYDMIEVHAHGGYLIAQFMFPYFNKRTDEYGGSLDNRCRFLMEIVDSIRKAVGREFPLTVKYSIEDFLPDSWDVKQSQILARKLEAAGVDGIGISCGVHNAKLPASPPYFIPRGKFIPFAEAIKEVVNIPVMVGGRLNDPELADKVLKDGKADFINIGRGLIADPDWPQKVASGKIKEIRPCLACNECKQCMVRASWVRCSVNAVAGREVEYDSIKPAKVKKKVLVAGGGPGGMEAARIASLRGHEVILCEGRRQLGGLLLLGGVHNQEINGLVKWMAAQIKGLPSALCSPIKGARRLGPTKEVLDL